MRTFYIFKINREMAVLTKDNPYNIFKSMEDIFKMTKKELSVGLNIYEQLISPINQNKVNQKIIMSYKDNDYYQKNYNVHSIFNKYKPEETKLTIKNSYLLLESNVIKPSFLKELSYDQNLFVCDFANKDYFWVDELSI
ncbi:MAG: sporulation inhibitor of replication protein SirA [Bacilli bacterium]|nr:sporulation inhibitor of replication protein SirA [Bacilli bacterium]